ncbi:AzlD domain-containing protein [Companilactobacillus sp.]|jgi:branched-subunit amino acid transport protein|uniref:AzlD domain-containing protein n=1 Tax=Companilactobacillus sp. TaxID=2767905 RepID=UPI0025BAADA6|nr:AzlD domain-containing protein [Companilactobacillus sp.]MCH4010049.1 AzlD domain-containing protein [Companilactobacillus sp.]MCH4052275.1 AzlD domain-containing protein [Companilactobacillus sp.]MCH4077991.1 AzlD domain-containing protein [Companilactobacillus sp.]MCH4126567.1 AzlD domain-containing protein [Companilactobacillus sp.]MCH4132153.1 AzlD domain-containing protein [Companilactobacillus sp.]
MPSFNFIILTILGSGIVTWLSRILPFWILRKVKLSPRVVEFLSFVPIVIMSALWFENLFHQHLGQLPSVDMPNFLATLPTVVSAIISKNLLVIVIVGIISLAVVRLVI